MVHGLPEKIRSVLARLSIHAADVVAISRYEANIAVVLVDRAFAFVGAVRLQLPITRELLLSLELLLLLGLPSAIDLVLLNLAVLLSAPLIVLLRRAESILFRRRAGLVSARPLRTGFLRTGLLRTRLVVASPVISLLGLAAPGAARSSRWLRRRLLALFLATAPIVAASLRLCRRGNEEKGGSC